MLASVSSCKEFDSLQTSICYKNFQFSLVLQKLSIISEVYEILKLIINYQQLKLRILENKEYYYI